MHFSANLVPTEQQYREKTGFEEEGEDAFRRQGAAEHIADVARIRRPVCAKLEFHYNARGHAYGKREREHARPEPRHLMIKRIICFQPQRLDDDENDAKADAQRRINVVKRDSRGELDA